MFRVLKEIFDQLPVMTINGKDYKPVFDFGTQEQLSANLSLRRKSGERYYPLIYLETPLKEDSNMDFRFILATINRKVDMRNVDRLKWSFEDTLEPLLYYVNHALKQSGVFRRNKDTPDKYYKGEKHFNYHMTPDIWDAIVYETSFRYNGGCTVKTINFKTYADLMLEFSDTDPGMDTETTFDSLV